DHLVAVAVAVEQERVPAALGRDAGAELAGGRDVRVERGFGHVSSVTPRPTTKGLDAPPPRAAEAPPHGRWAGGPPARTLGACSESPSSSPSPSPSPSFPPPRRPRTTRTTGPSPTACSSAPTAIGTRAPGCTPGSARARTPTCCSLTRSRR